MIPKNERCDMIIRMDIDRRKLIREIKKSIKPYLHESGYVNTLLATFGSYKSGEKEGQAIARKNQNFDFEIEGFTQDGVIVDHYCAIVTRDYKTLGLRELDWVYMVASDAHWGKTLK